jgi:hypothetical protein
MTILCEACASARAGAREKVLNILKLDTPPLDVAISTDSKNVFDLTHEGIRIGVRRVPSLFVNGRKLKDRSLKGFQVLIDKELKMLKQKK